MKIGFLAMSGIRAHDPELLELGLTLPGFVERSKTIASLPSLGLLYLAAVHAAAGTSCATSKPRRDGTEPAEVYDCDLVAISTFSAQVFEAYAIADRLRWRGVTRRDGRSARHGSARGSGRSTRTTSSSARASTSGRRSCAPRSAASRRGSSMPRLPDRSTSPSCPCRATTCSATAPTTASRCRPRAAARGDAISAPRP